MNDVPRDDSAFDPGALARRILRATPWAIGAALLAAGVAALVDAAVPPTYQASLSLHLTPPAVPLPAGVLWPAQITELETLLQGVGTRDAVAKDPDARKALGAGDGPDGDGRFADEYRRRVSVVPGTPGQTVWVVVRATDPGLAGRLALRVADAGSALVRNELLGARDRFAVAWTQRQARLLDDLRNVDAELGKSGYAVRPETSGTRPVEVEPLLARRRVLVAALEEIEGQRLAVRDAVEAGGGPWIVEGPAGRTGELVPRDRLRPLAGPALFAAALATLLHLLRDGRSRPD